MEPEGSQALTRALEAGTPVPVPIDSIAADSLGASPIGAVPFASIVGRVKATVLASDDEIRSAQRWLWSNLRLVAEPGGAAALAAVLAGRRRMDGRRLVVAVCGSNTDPATVV